MKKKILTLLVLLMTAVTGAWAQEETLLVTIESKDYVSFKSGSKTFDNIATVTFSAEVLNVGDYWGWCYNVERTLTVTAAEGYTITRVKFYTTSGSAFDEEAPFEAIFGYKDGTIVTKVNGTSIGEFGVTKIEVYGYVPLNHSANNTWTLAATPAFELEVEYFNITVPTANTADIYIGTTTPLINAGSTTEDGATMKYLVTATNEQPTSTDGFSTDVPTALPLTGPGTYYVWYFLDFATGADSDISAQAVEVTVSFHVTMKEGTLDADNWQGKAGEGEYQALPLTGLEAGTAVSVKYNGTKKVKSVKAKKKATAKDKGKLICTDGHIHAYGEDAECTADRVAKIIYIGPTGHATYNHGLALALTDERSVTNWPVAMRACDSKNTSTPVTDATWLLASKDQWDYMLGADGAGSYTALRDGFSSVGGSNLQSVGYWSSTEIGSVYAWDFHFDDGLWYLPYKDDADVRARACLAFGALDPDPIDLTPSADGTVWTLAATPAFDVELEVEYYDEVTLAIGTLYTRTGEVSFDSEAWYTLDGKRLNAKPNTKGIYVNNGKKVVIK